MKKARSRKKAVPPIPAGYHTVTPYLACGDGAAAIEFYKKAFGAQEKMRMPGPGGKVGHAEIAIGDSRIMLTSEYAAMDFLSPVSRGGTTVHIDQRIRSATKRAAKKMQPTSSVELR